MQTRNRNTFTTIHTEGALLPVDLLQRISENDKSLEGLDPQSYHLAPGEKINEAINRSWNRMNGLWGAFKTSRGRLGPSDAGTTLTRERWLLPLFQELGFGRLSTAKAVEIEGKSYPISHRWEKVPIHLVGCGLDLDRRTPGAAGAARISPHSLMQEYLNRDDEAQWGLLSNGLHLRILRDNASLTRQAYIDFDLESMFEGEVYSDFVLLWLLAHQSRFEIVEKQSECLLERWSKSAQERGTRALDDLRRGVEEAIVSLGQGFLQHPLNADLRGRLKKGELPAQDYYRQLLRLVYRLIFLFAAEDRDLLLLPDAAPEAKERYKRHYSTARLRALAERQRGSRHYDRYEALRLLMTLLGSEKGCPELAIPALGGFLFDPRSTADLNEARLDNQSQLSAVRSLAFINERNTRRAVDYRNLGPEELGSVYESLLELHPLLNIEAGTFQLTSAAGNERKTTGSYYTPTSLIRVLLDSALDPVIEDRLKGKETAAQQEQALLDLKVCDPACGSGHFLIAAAHRIAGRLAQARAGGDEPPPNETRRALRDVIRHCIYGVDINPMSVELCKVNLWLESLEPGKPLSFLDAHIQCGDSLVGVTPNLDITEIPDEAFNPVFIDDKTTSTALKKRNKQERSGQFSLFGRLYSDQDEAHALQAIAEKSALVDLMPEDTPSQVHAKESAFTELTEAIVFHKKELEYNLWTGAFFWPIKKANVDLMIAPTYQALCAVRANEPLKPELIEKVTELARQVKFFHWDLRFPHVFSGDLPGFDCIIGNPPWEMIQFDPREFFASVAPNISDARNLSEREKLIQKLSDENRELFEAYQEEQRKTHVWQKFVHESKRFPFTSYGRINLMSLFAEATISLISPNGYSGLVIPTGIATDSFNQYFFSNLISEGRLEKFIGFENEEFIFPGIANVIKFCLFVISGSAKKQNAPTFAFYLRKISQLKEAERFYQLSKSDFHLFNPNTGTSPIFRTVVDSTLTKYIYTHFPVLLMEKGQENPWGYKGVVMFMMNTDSHLFKTKFSEGCLPLYEGKLFWHFEHRFGSYDLVGTAKGKGGRGLPDMPTSNLENSEYTITPQYWIEEKEVFQRIPSFWSKKWIIAYRKVTSAKLERTTVCSILPYSGVGDSANVITLDYKSAAHISCFVTNLNSLVFDFVVRQKLGGTNFNFYILEQLPVLPPDAYKPEQLSFIVPRVLELIYTADDIKAFALDMDYDGEPFHWNEERRAFLRAELDAYYARLYGLNRKQLRYILDPADLTPRELEDILDSWEEVADPLDQQGYAQRAAVSDFPGETFRVLKEKEISKYGEYRTRRLVLEAWERLSASGWTDAGGMAPLPQVDRRPEPVVEVRSQPVVEPVREEPKPVKREPAVKEQEKEETPMQPALSDFGLYKCEACGKMVMGYEKAKHEQEKHGGKKVEWKKMR